LPYLAKEVFKQSLTDSNNMSLEFKNYTKFNDWVYEVFLKPNINNYSNVASIFIDIQAIENQEYFTEACTFLREVEWHKLCISESHIPQYLGLVAIQLLAASSRQNDELCSSAAYNPRLRKILSLSDDNKLQAKYRDAQENIYDCFERWCKKNNFSIYLSHSSVGHRYVQYPLSLALLHKKDIDSLGSFFHKCGLAQDDEIDFDVFKKIVLDRQGSFPPGIYQKWRNIDKGRKEGVLKQMYYAYLNLNWDGLYDDKHRPSPNIKLGKEYTMYWTGGEDSEPEFRCNNDLIKDVAFLEKGIFFIQDSINWNDWNLISEKCISSKSNQRYVLAYLNETPFFNDLKNFFEQQPYCYGKLKLYPLDTAQITELEIRFPDRFKQAPAIHLIGGIKLGYREWMEGVGPILEAENYSALTVRLANLKFDYGKEWKVLEISEQRLMHLPPGRYFLQYSADMPLIHFKITSPIACEDYDAKTGWELTENGYRVTSESTYIRGLDFSKIPIELLNAQTKKMQPGNLVRQWMELVTRDTTKVFDNENYIHKVLRRHNNGICNR